MRLHKCICQDSCNFDATFYVVSKRPAKLLHCQGSTACAEQFSGLCLSADMLLRRTGYRLSIEVRG
jgi:hypothetical protein